MAWTQDRPEVEGVGWELWFRAVRPSLSGVGSLCSLPPGILGGGAEGDRGVKAGCAGRGEGQRVELPK